MREPQFILQRCKNPFDHKKDDMKQHCEERRSQLTIHYSEEQPRSVSESFQEHWPESPWVSAGTVPRSQQGSVAFARGGSGPWLVFTEEEPRNCES